MVTSSNRIELFISVEFPMVQFFPIITFSLIYAQCFISVLSSIIHGPIMVAVLAIVTFFPIHIFGFISVYLDLSISFIIVFKLFITSHGYLYILKYLTILRDGILIINL